MTRVRDWLRLHRRDAAALALLVVLGAGFFYEMIAVDAVPVARDVQLFFLPHKHILWEAFQQGSLPLWTPLVRTGHPVLANFQSGVFYPPHWLFGVLPFLTAFNVLVVLHVVLAGVGAYLLARTLEFEPPSSLVAAVAFMLGGYLVSLTNLVNHLQAAAWAPLMIAVVIRHAYGWRPGTFVQALVVYLVAFLAGAPQTFLLGAVTALLVGLAWTGRHGGDGAPGPGRLVATLAALAVAVGALAAVQVLPTLEMVRLSGRSSGLAMHEAGRYSLAPVRLFHLLVPNAFSDPVYRFGGKMQLSAADPWLFSVYVGVAVLAVAWHARLDRGRRRLVVLWCVLAVGGVLLALGKHLPLFPWLHAHVPGLGAFRYPEKFFLFTGLAVPMLAAHGTSALLRRPEPGRLDGIAALGALTAGLAGLLVWSTAPARIHAGLRALSPDAPALGHFAFAYVQWGAQLEVVLGVLAATVGLLLVYRRGKLETASFVALVIAAVGVDLWIAHRGLNPVVAPSFYRESPPVVRQVADEELGTTYRWRASPFDENLGSFWGGDLSKLTAKWVMQRSMQPSTAALWGVQGHDAMDAIHLELHRMQDWLFRELPTDRRVRLLRLGSVASVYAGVVNPELEGRSRVVPADSVPGYLHRLEDPLPRAYLAHGRCYVDGLDALNAALRPSTDPHREVTILTDEEADGPDRPPGAGDPGGDDGAAELEGGRLRGGPDGRAGADGGSADGDGPCADAAASGDRPDTAASGRPSDPGSARIVADAGGRITVEVSPREPSFLVLTDTWYPGWQAFVDGEERRIWRANYFFRAVRVDPGDRRVVFRFRPRSFELGKRISMGSFVLLLVGLWGWRLRAGRRGRDSGGEGPAAPDAVDGPPSSLGSR